MDVRVQSLLEMMKAQGATSLKVKDKEGFEFEAHMPLRDRTRIVIPVEEPESTDDMDDIDFSTKLSIPDPEGEGSVYDDPDLYPDGVDPIAEMKERMSLFREVTRGE